MAKLFNGGHVPQVYDWFKPAVPPGGFFETDIPETFGVPWTLDEQEAAAAARASGHAVPQAPPSDAVSVPQDAPQAPPAPVPPATVPANLNPDPVEGSSTPPTPPSTTAANPANPQETT